eukprot:TRINITY_DN2176_c0_g1_i2.p1 TRINITY_DN2176_c0_g1~~TRINITY_DN2176_c0_g1_i2.p1  ORF type:complete len:279 (-),score=15.78 TRINITY_DN2176_c0_g1_i2:487-1323(-)
MYQSGEGGAKRSRTGRGGDDDWTCPSCGNVNFSFRSTCNMKKCGAPKPASLLSGTHILPLGGPQFYDPHPVGQYSGGSQSLPSYVPSSSYAHPTTQILSIEPAYASSQVYGPPTSSYLSSNGHYGPILNGPTYHSQATPLEPYSLSRVQPIIPPPGPLGPPLYGPDPILDIRKRRGGPEASSFGDWVCPKCGNTNFTFREVCNMRKCKEPKPSLEPEPSLEPQGRGGSKPDETPPEGSWTCKECSNINYPFRTKCNRRNCGAERPSEKESENKTPGSS